MNWALAKLTLADGTEFDKVSAVVNAATGTLTVRRRRDIVLKREDVTAVVDTGPNARRVEFGDGSSLEAVRLTGGGCAACGQRR